MNGVIGMSQILSETSLDNTQREYVDIIPGSAKALLSLINDVLDLSKIEADRLELEHVEFDLRDVIYETVAATALQSAVKGIELIVNVGIDVPADGTRRSGAPAPDRHEPDRQCHQVHARRPRDPGHDRLLGRGRPAHLRIEVADTGIGIPAERIDRLFKTFRKSIPPPHATTAAPASGCRSSNASPN